MRDDEKLVLPYILYLISISECFYNGILVTPNGIIDKFLFFLGGGLTTYMWDHNKWFLTHFPDIQMKAAVSRVGNTK